MLAAIILTEQNFVKSPRGKLSAQQEKGGNQLGASFKSVRPLKRAVSAAPVATSHTRNVAPSDPEASRPSGSVSKERRNSLLVHQDIEVVSAPPERSHSRIVVSQEPDAIRLSASRQSAVTLRVCPTRRVVSVPVTRSCCTGSSCRQSLEAAGVRSQNGC